MTSKFPLRGESENGDPKRVLLVVTTSREEDSPFLASFFFSWIDYDLLKIDAVTLQTPQILGDLVLFEADVVCSQALRQLKQKFRRVMTIGSSNELKARES